MTPTRSQSDGPDEDLRIECTFDDDTPPSIAIIRAIAIIEDTNPINVTDEQGITLFDYIDPGALDRLVTDDTGNNVTIDLDLNPDHEYAVQISDTGQVVVRKAG